MKSNPNCAIRYKTSSTDLRLPGKEVLTNEQTSRVCETTSALRNNDSAGGVLIYRNQTRNCTYLAESVEACGRQAKKERDVVEE